MENGKQLAVAELNEIMEIGDVFFQSGMFPTIKSKAQAAVKILAGRELGLSPMEAINGLYMVNDHIAVTAKIIASKIKKSGKYDYTVNKLDDTECSLTFFEIKGDQLVKLGDSIFTIKDAAKAGIVNKDVWKNYPRNMMFARAISNGNIWYCPDATTGFYSVEELQDLEAEKKGDVITISAEGEVTKEMENGQTGA
jgi:hypothetical protein